MAEPNNQNPPANTADPAGINPGQQGGTGTGTGDPTNRGTNQQQGQGGGQSAFTPEQQTYINQIAANAREDGRKAAERAAEQQRQAEAGQFKPLYEQEKSRADAATAQLAELQTRYDKLKVAFEARIDAELQALPETVRAKVMKLKPTEDDPDKLNEFVKTAKELAAETGTGNPSRLPNDPAPRGGGEPRKQVEAVEQNRQTFRRSGKYSGF